MKACCAAILLSLTLGVVGNVVAGEPPAQAKGGIAAGGVGLNGLPPATGGDANERSSGNLLGLLLASFLIFVMQAGFALVETGLIRAKNVAHTMAMNLLAFTAAALGFWVCGFALMLGGTGRIVGLGSDVLLTHELALPIAGHEFGFLGYQGFFLAGSGLDSGLLALFFFQVMYVVTAASIPTGALSERWRFASLFAFGFFASALLVPVYGNWVWGNGWLAQLGSHWGLGHGHVDFAGSSVVHMLGGVAALAGALSLGPRLGKFRPDGTANPVPSHNVPMYMLGTLLLAFGWFGFNTGRCLGASDLNSARIAVNTILAAAAAALASLYYMAAAYRRPDPSFLCNSLLGGLVAISGPCAFVAPWAAVLIGAVAGVLVIWGCLFLERVGRIDDPVGAISAHGLGGAWGTLAIGLFADGTYGNGLNHVEGGVAGLFYGDSAQLAAQLIGIAVCFCWALPMALFFFTAADRLIGNRVSAQVEMQGLDVPEVGALGYVGHDPKSLENRLLTQTAEPRAAKLPPELSRRFQLQVEGAEDELLAQTWSGLCQVGDLPPPADFRSLYPFMTTLRANIFAFRGGDPEATRAALERLLQNRLQEKNIKVTRLEC